MKLWRVRSLSFLLVSTICLTSVYADTESEGSGIRLGVVAPLSGDFATYGEQIQNGVELALSNIDYKSTDVRIVYEDACLPAEAIRAAKKLVSADKIHMLAATYCGIGMGAMASTLMDAHVPSFFTAVVPDSLVVAGDYIVSTNAAVRDEAFELADDAFKTFGARTAYTLHVPTQWGESFERNFRARFEALGGRVVGTAPVAIEMNDFRSELTGARTKHPDVLVLVHVGPHLGNLIKQARQLGYKGQLLSTDEAEAPSVIEKAGEAAEGLRFVSPLARESSLLWKDFSASYRARFDAFPTALSANAYDATLLGISALRKCSLDPVCTKNELLATKDYAGVSGTFSIRKGQPTIKAFHLRTVRDSRFVDAD